MSSFPGISLSDTFNPDDFISNDSSLTISTGDERYVRIGSFAVLSALNVVGNVNVGSLSIDGVSFDTSSLTYLTDITPGIASASKALILDSNKEIEGINSIRIGTSNDPNRQLSILDTTQTIGTTRYDFAYGVTDSLNNQLEVGFKYVGDNSTDNCGVFGFYANTEILVIGADKTVDIAKHNGSTFGLKLGGTLITSTAEQLNYLDIVTPGQALASKALILDNLRSVTSINEISANNLTCNAGDITLNDNFKIIFERDISSSDLNSFIGSNTDANLHLASTRGNGYISMETNGSGSKIFELNDSLNARNTLMCFANKLGINKLTSTSSLSYNLDVEGSFNATSFYSNGSLMNASCLTLTSEGVALATKALITNSSNNISGINTLSANTINADIINLDGNPISFASESTVTANTLLSGSSTATIQFDASIDSGVSNSLGFAFSKIYFENKLKFATDAGFQLSADFVGLANASFEYFDIDMPSSFYGDKSFNIRCVHDDKFISIGSTGTNALLISPNNTDTVSTRALRLTTESLSYNTASIPAGFDFVINNTQAAKFNAKRFCIGDTDDTTRFISALNGSQATGTTERICWGRANSTNNQCELGFNYQGSTLSSNNMTFGFHTNSNLMTLFADGNLSIGSSSSYVPLFVQATKTISYGSMGSTVYRLRTSSGVTESAVGPINYSTSIYSNGYIGADALATTSDRRLKENISPLELDHVKSFYETCEPVKYNWKKESSMQSDMPEVGLISQDVLKHGFMDLISMNPKPGLVKSCEYDHDDVQLGLRYDRLGVYHMAMIQDLIKRIEILESKPHNKPKKNE